MHKIVFLFLILAATLTAKSAEQNPFDRNCVPCHTSVGVSLRKTFMNALLVYSGKENMKAGLAYFLRYPRKDISVMGEKYFATHALKEPTTLDRRELEEALEIFWERYKVIGHLR
ncbi:hypothetical protein [Nitratifractor sp.]